MYGSACSTRTRDGDPIDEALLKNVAPTHWTHIDLVVAQYGLNG